MEKHALLLVDDDKSFLAMAADALANEGFAISTAANAKEALDLLSKNMPELVITDLVMPKMNGLEFCKRLKASGRTAGLPVILLTGSDKEGQQITALDTGADDYLTKPVDLDVLSARCRALLRRSGREKPPPPVLRFGKMILDYAGKSVSLGGKDYPGLTPREFEVLYELAANQPRPYSRVELYERLWGNPPPSKGSLKTIDVHLQRIRFKLGLASGRWLVRITGRGYAFKPA